MDNNIVTILVVDDEERICSKIKHGLERINENYNIFIATSGQNALTQLKNESFDILVTDIRMPGMDGIELLKQAKEIREDLQTIILTGHGDLNNAIDALRLGASNYIKKPVSFEVLHYTIEKAYEKLELIRQLRESEERYRSSFFIAATGMVIVPPNGIITHVNQSFCQMLRFRRDELLNRNIRDLVHENDLARFVDNLNDLVMGRAEQFQMDVQFVRQDDNVIWTNLNVSSVREDNIPVYVVMQVLDITNRKNMEDKLRFFSIHDSLTGLYNRTFFEAEVSRLERGRHQVISVVMADLDGLKGINDTYGHAAGDEYIRTAAEVLRQSFRADDAVCRVGGDEFTVLLPGAPLEVAERSIRHIENELTKLTIQTTEMDEAIPVRISFGHALWENKNTLAETLKLADKRMYDNKFNKKTFRNSSGSEAPDK